MQNEISVINEENIKDQIYIIRGKEVMLDSEVSAAKCHNYLYNKIVTLCGVNFKRVLVLFGLFILTKHNIYST